MGVHWKVAVVEDDLPLARATSRSPDGLGMTFRRFSLGIVLLAAGCEVAAIVLAPPVSEPLREAGIGILAATGLFLADRMPVRIGPNRKATLGTAPIIFAALLLSPPVAAAFTGGAFCSATGCSAGAGSTAPTTPLRLCSSPWSPALPRDR
jgi:hypothetical protein